MPDTFDSTRLRAAATANIGPAAAREIVLIVSIDTEEDNWAPSRNGVTLENIGQLARLHTFLEGLGVRPTYFTAYQVAALPAGARAIRGLAERGTAEIGAHLHPWNTPPLTDPIEPGSSMLKNLPAALQRAKLEQLTAALEETVGTRPTAFRAGRYGLGPSTVGALIACGYRVDSSVTPYVNWEDTDDGPNFVGAPLGLYQLGPERDVRTPDPAGALLEIPVSAGYTRPGFAVRDRAFRLLGLPALRPFRLAGLAWRAGLLRRVVLSPETASVPDMLALSERLIERGVQHLNLTWHSQSLCPGLSPFVATTADRDRLYRAIASYLEGLARLTAIRCATVSEAAAILTAPDDHPRGRL